jgi:hypothetical protein
MLLRVFGIVFMLPFGVYLFRGMSVAGLVVSAFNPVVAYTKAPFFLTG